MLLKYASSLSLVNAHGVKKDISPLFSSSVSSGKNLSFSVRASTEPLSGVVFEPFVEVKKELDLVPSSPQLSLARHMYSPECEAAVNEQINVEYNVSYVYHALYAYFDRDNVALKGLAKFFKDSSVEERDHAEMLMEYQNKRGGRVKLQPMVMPQSEFDHAEKGDALYVVRVDINISFGKVVTFHQKRIPFWWKNNNDDDVLCFVEAMELALSLEKLVNEKLLNLHSVASKNDDVQLADFIESEFLNEQVEAIKKISEYVSQLRRLGKGHGTWHFDQELLETAAA
ncbi:hypothetical protein Bca4012_039433 [Brassica carinata]